MNKSSSLIAIAAFAAFASFGANAESPDANGQFSLQFDGSRTRAEVMPSILSCASVGVGNTLGRDAMASGTEVLRQELCAVIRADMLKESWKAP